MRPARPAYDEDDGEDRMRMRQNLAAFLVIVAIVGLGAALGAFIEDGAVASFWTTVATAPVLTVHATWIGTRWARPRPRVDAVSPVFE